MSNTSQKIIITGAAGFIGTNVARYFSERGYSIVAVDYLEHVRKPAFESERYKFRARHPGGGRGVSADTASPSRWVSQPKFVPRSRNGVSEHALRERDDIKKKNLEVFEHERYYDGDEFLELAKKDALPNVDAIIHLGACSDTQEKDREFLMRNNLEYSKELFNYCVRSGARFLYASSAATYGDGSRGYNDTERKLEPLNLYGLSKYLFDEWVLEQEKKPPQWVGFKFFNVYGPYENHKGDMASVVYKGFNEIKMTGKLELFKSYRAGYNDGEQKRDFIYVDDISDVMSFFLEYSKINGIFNVGTGKARTFLDLGRAIFSALDYEINILFKDMPEDLQRQYQYITEADLSTLRSTGYTKEFTSLEDGVKKYVKWLENKIPR